MFYKHNKNVLLCLYINLKSQQAQSNLIVIQHIMCYITVILLSGKLQLSYVTVILYLLGYKYLLLKYVMRD